MSLTNVINLQIISTLTKTVGLASVPAKISETIQETAAGADALFTVTGTIAGGAVTYDLDGALTDPLGDAVAFDKVLALFIRNNGDNAMTIGGANHLPIVADGSDRINLPAGAMLLLYDDDGWEVTAETGDQLIISGTDADTVDVVVIGIST